MNMKYCFLTALLLLTCLSFCSSAAAAPTDSIMELMGVTYKIANPESTGTCFLISRPTGDTGQVETILVTAAHVLERMSGPECVLVLREKRSDDQFIRKEVPLKIREKDAPLWVKHPEEDVAAMKVQLPKDVSYAALPADQILGEADIKSGKLHTGDEVWTCCFPAKLEPNGSGFPVLRRGNVSSFPLTPIATYKSFLVDSPTFGGESGAPVMISLPSDGAQDKSKQRPWIVGLVSGMHRQTDKAVLELGELTLHHPLGLSITVPGEFIRQTIDRVPRGEKKPGDNKDKR
jgi:hypothetical protein